MSLVQRPQALPHSTPSPATVESRRAEESYVEKDIHGNAFLFGTQTSGELASARVACRMHLPVSAAMISLLCVRGGREHR